MGFLELFESLSGRELPKHFTFDGRQYPLEPLYQHVEDSAEAQAAVLQVLQDSVGAEIEGEEVGDPDPVPIPPEVEMPAKLRLRITGARYPNGVAVDRERLDGWIAGTHNLNFSSRVWLDATPEPDTVRAIPKMMLTTRWYVTHQDGRRAFFLGNGRTLPAPRPEWPARRIADGAVRQPFDVGFEGGIFLQEYALSGGYHASIRLPEGQYSIWVEVTRPDGEVLVSNVFKDMRVS